MPYQDQRLQRCQWAQRWLQERMVKCRRLYRLPRLEVGWESPPGRLLGY